MATIQPVDLVNQLAPNPSIEITIKQDTDFETVLNDVQQGTAKSKYESYFKQASDTYGVDINLLKAVAKAESNFNANVTSNAGAMGVMQLMPQTAAHLGVKNPYDAKENIMGGAKLLAEHLNQYNGDISLALAAYSCGIGAVARYGGIPPYGETSAYIQKILNYMNNGVEVPVTASLSSVSNSSTPTTQSASTTEFIPVLTKEEQELQHTLSELPSYDIHVTSTEESDQIVTNSSTTAKSKKADEELKNDTTKQSSSSRADYLDYVNNYMNIISGNNNSQSNENNTITNLLTNYLNSNSNSSKTVNTASLLNLIKNRLSETESSSPSNN